MVRVLIATIIGSVLMFAWNAVSWMVLPVHETSFKYTPHQAAIMRTLDSVITEDGMYIIPQIDPADPNRGEKETQLLKDMVGKPTAMVAYKRQAPPMDFKMMGLGFLYVFLGIFLAAIILMAAGDKLPSFASRLWIVMLLPMIISLNAEMANLNWMGFPWHFVSGSIIDHFVGWALAGSVLAAMIKTRN